MRRVFFVSAVLCCLTGTFRAQTPTTTTNHTPANALPEIKNGADVQAAIIAACNGTNPGSVTLPPGELLVSATVSIPSRCSLLGASSGRTVLRATNSFAPNSPAALLSVADKKDVALQNLTLDGNHSENPHIFTLLQIDSSTNVSVDDIHGTNSGNGVTVLHASIRHDRELRGRTMRHSFAISEWRGRRYFSRRVATLPRACRGLSHSRQQSGNLSVQ